MITRRSLIKTAATAPIVAAGLATSRPSTTVAQDVTTVGLAHIWAAEDVAPLIQAFEAANPTIKIAYEYIPFAQFNDTMIARISSGDTSLDVYGADQSRTASLAARGLLLDLTDLVPTEDLAPLRPSTVQGSTWNGRLWSLPAETSTQLLYYNVALLEQAGVEAPPDDPTAAWTWEHLVEAAKQTQSAGAEWGIMLEQIDRYYQIQPLPESLNGGPGLTGPDLLTPDLLNPGWIAAMEFYQRLFAEGLGPRGIDASQTGNLFMTGQLAFYYAGPWNVTFIPELGPDIEFGIAPVPYFENGKPASPTDSWSWGISPHSTKQEAALAFVRFASLTKEGQLAHGSTHGAQPLAHMEAAEQQLTAIVEGNERLSQLPDIIAYQLENTAVHRPPSVGYIQFEEIMGRAFADIRGGSDVQGRLQEASNALEEAFAQLTG